MGDVINLRLIRKTRRRDAAAMQAAANRAAHGRTGAEKAADRLLQDRRDRLLDGARLAVAPADDGPADTS